MIAKIVKKTRFFETWEVSLGEWSLSIEVGGCRDETPLHAYVVDINVRWVEKHLVIRHWP